MPRPYAMAAKPLSVKVAMVPARHGGNGASKVRLKWVIEDISSVH